MFLKGKCALATGSTSGIGLAYARALAAEGATLVVNGFGEASAIAALVAELKQTSGAEAIHVDADLTRREGVEAMMDAAAERFGGVDILINNAANMTNLPPYGLRNIPADAGDWINGQTLIIDGGWITRL